MDVAEFNRTDRSFPDNVTLQELVEEQVRQRSSQTGVICDHDTFFGSSTLTYGEINAKANQVAHFLRAAGAHPGDIVGIVVERSFAMMVGVLGILKSGCAYLPIATDTPGQRLHYILQDADIRILLTQTKLADSFVFAGRVIALDDPKVYESPAENLSLVNRPGDLAYVIYTSGSTGKPKGVMIEHRSVVNRLHWMQSAYPVGPDDVILQKTPFYFDVSVWELFWWALSGAKLCFLMPRGE